MMSCNQILFHISLFPRPAWSNGYKFQLIFISQSKQIGPLDASFSLVKKSPHAEDAIRASPRAVSSAGGLLEDSTVPLITLHSLLTRYFTAFYRNKPPKAFTALLTV